MARGSNSGRSGPSPPPGGLLSHRYNFGLRSTTLTLRRSCPVSTRSLRIWGLLAAGALSAATLSACANNSDSEGAAGSSSSASVEKDADLAALVPDEIAGRGTIKVGTDPTYAPNEFKDDNGKIVGFDVDLFNAVGEKLGLNAEYHASMFDKIIPGVQARQLRRRACPRSPTTPSASRWSTWSPTSTPAPSGRRAAGRRRRPRQRLRPEGRRPDRHRAGTTTSPPRSKACTDAGKQGDRDPAVRRPGRRHQRRRARPGRRDARPTPR